MTMEVRALRIIEALERGAARLNDVIGCVRKEERGGRKGRIGMERAGKRGE